LERVEDMILGLKNISCYSFTHVVEESDYRSDVDYIYEDNCDMFVANIIANVQHA
jgi:hypothetical protein